MTDDAQRWKAKYLKSLEQQELQEKLWNERLDLLRRGLVRSSLAAEGSDKAVDQCMQELRELIRGEQMDNGLSALIPRLEKAVLDSEQRRQQRIEQNIAGITDLTQQLLALDPPREVRKALKQFAKRIDERASQSREMPALLAELSSLQGKTLTVLGSAPVERPGLLQRLFGGGRDEAVAEAPAAQLQAQAPAAIMPDDEGDEPAPAAAPLLPAAAAPTAEVVPPAALAEPTPAARPLAPLPAAVASLDSLPLDARILTGEGDPSFALPESPSRGTARWRHMWRRACWACSTSWSCRRTTSRRARPCASGCAAG